MSIENLKLMVYGDLAKTLISVKEIVDTVPAPTTPEAANVAELAEEAELADVITALNAVIASLVDAGLMASE